MGDGAGEVKANRRGACMRLWAKAGRGYRPGARPDPRLKCSLFVLDVSGLRIIIPSVQPR